MLSCMLAECLEGGAYLFEDAAKERAREDLKLSGGPKAGPQMAPTLAGLLGEEEGGEVGVEVRAGAPVGSSWRTC